MKPIEPRRMSFLKRPAPVTKSRVGITCGKEYAEAERMVNEAIELLGIENICKAGDNVLVKPNLCLPTPPEDAETTHPAIVAAVVRRTKQEGGRGWVDTVNWQVPAAVAIGITTDFQRVLLE